MQKIAEIAAIPLGTVKSRLFRARQLLLERSTQKGNRDAR
jgi:DNA-directed RNA polymerase specialized sigma24 family protein